MSNQAMGACAMPLIEEEATIATGAMPQDKASNEPVLLTLKESLAFNIMQRISLASMY